MADLTYVRLAEAVLVAQQQPGNQAAEQLLRSGMQQAIRLLDDIDNLYRTS